MSLNNDEVEMEEDFLEVDRPVSGQNYSCISFVSPEKILKKKEIYMFSEYLKDFIKTKSTPDTEQFREKNDMFELLQKGELGYEALQESYDNFVYRSKEQLEKQFYEENNFQTTVRGVKVRGVYDTLREAEVRAKVLRKRDKNFHVYVGQVGYWLPWEPDADEVGNQEYQESHLNTLVKKYNENKESRDDMYEQIKQEKLDSAAKKTREAKRLLVKQKKEQTLLGEDDTTDESSSSVTTTASVENAEEKIGPLRELLNKKDGMYDELMDSKAVEESDPWMQRKEAEKKAKAKADEDNAKAKADEEKAKVEEVE